MSKNNYDEQLKQEAIESVKKILAQSRLSEFVTISSIPERSGKFLLNYGNITFKCKEKNSWNLNGINVYVKKGSKVDRTNPRQIQFKLVADYSDEAINGKFLGCKYAFMQEICTRCSAWMALKHGVFCFEEDAIDVANCIAEIMSEGDERFLADYDLNNELNVCLGSKDERIAISIKSRRGQRQFREKLLAKYDSKCLITGCNITQILEAAHISPHCEKTNYNEDNGLLLRADIHTLFDLHLITIDKNSIVTIDDSLINSEYEQYNGKQLFKTVAKDMRTNLESRLKLI
ncbi:HNH endonuclease [Photobacterium leiognathi]|uniref:HNH endonuclease n=1 Tax=Photobacterium leiognathi TaxID=553611 RepID=UPI00298197EB|nr:HNH endonuclease signature motif containing protein [Photobacterium leiognathi]